MIKNIMAFIGFLVVTLLIIFSVGGIGLFYDQIGIVSLPKMALPKLPELTSLVPPGEVTVISSPSTKIKRSNPLLSTPMPDPTAVLFAPTEVPFIEPTFLPSPTPVPPLDPLVYQSEVVLRMKTFAAALEQWMEANDRLASDNSLLGDSTWQNEMKVDLNNVSRAGRSMASVLPPPVEYDSIQALLNEIPPEVEMMQTNYLQGMDTGDMNSLQAAGESFKRIKEYLTQSASAMIAAGWVVN